MCDRRMVVTCIVKIGRKVLSYLPADSLGGRLAWGAFWSLAGAVVSQGSILAASVITARILGTAGFGEFGIINSTVGMFGVFAGFGLGMTATKHVAELRTTDPARAGRIIALSSAVALATGGLISLVLILLAPFLATRTLAAPHLVPEIRIAALLLLCNAQNGAQTGALCGLEAFKATAQANLARGLLSFPVLLAGVFLWGLPGAVWGLAVTAAAGCLINQQALRRECRRAGVPITSKGIWRERRILWDFSCPALLSSAMVGPVTWFASAVLVNQPDGYHEMGVFNAANQWRTAILFLPSVLSQSALPILSNLLGGSDLLNYKRLLWRNLPLVSGLALAVAVPVAAASPWIMAAYGPEFSRGWPVLVLLVSATVLSGACSVIGLAITSSGRMWWGFILNCVWAAALVAGCLLWVPSLKALGLALAFLASHGLHAINVAVFAVLNPPVRQPRPALEVANV